MIVAYVTGIAWAEASPVQALALFRRVIDVGEQRPYQNLLVGLARAHIAVLDEHEPARVLGGLLRALDEFRRAKLSFALRRLVRDFLPALAHLGRADVVAVLDGAAAPLSLCPHAAQRAVEEARTVLGAVRFEAAKDAGRAMADEALEAYLHAELDRLAAPCTGSAASSADGRNGGAGQRSR